MRQVTVLIFHPEPGPAAGPFERRLGAARGRLAGIHAAGFARAGANTVRIVAGPPDGRPFGSRLAEAVAQVRAQAGSRAAADAPRSGLVILGSGAIPQATQADRRSFVACARGSGPARALANNRFSADILAVADIDWLAALPGDFASDNALPRWLTERAGIEVADLGRRSRLAADLDSPLDLVLLGRIGRRLDPDPRSGDEVVIDHLAGVRRVMADPRAELVVAGRTSAATIGWLERHVRCRVRALVEERGLRSSGRLTGGPAQRPPRSILGMLLDRDGPAALGARLAELGDAAIVDSRVLLAHRLGADELGWPAAEDRFASDLLEPVGIDDPWLRELTTSARQAKIPILLGGHSLVGPGVRLIAGR